MAKNHCLICFTDIKSSPAIEESLIDDETNFFLAKDLHVIFVLRNIFEIPHENLQSYLIQNGNPSEWDFLRLCRGCGEAVMNAKRIHQELVETLQIFAAVKGEIVGTVKRSVERLRQSKLKQNGSSRVLQGDDRRLDKATRIVEETREFISKHDYGPTTDPFPDGDCIASNMCTSTSSKRSNYQLPNQCVKTEGDADFFDEDDVLLGLAPGTVIHEKVPKMNLLQEPNDIELEVPPMPNLKAEASAHEKIPLFPPKKRSRPNRDDHPGQIFSVPKQHFKIMPSEKQKSSSPTKRRRPLGKSNQKVIKGAFKCDYKDCNKTYTTKCKLQIHQMNHRGEKPFKCSWPNCSWRYTRADVLRRHYRLHLPERQFKCQFCTKEYSRRDVLDKHVKNRHS